MRIDKLTASFGRLKQQTLSPGPALTVIEAPNESGKSTWCAFLRVMLYGLPTRERGALADKNRYAPWDGTPMQGSIELSDDSRRITITRDTARANAPMARFSAVYTGTAEPVPDLSADHCGEALLGVPREVFERSVFIRQTGLAVDQSPELERRIAALLSTGEEQSSFSEVYDRLKKELNRRRHNRTGLLPGLEGELAELEEQLRRSELLQARLLENESQTRRLTQRIEDVRELLHRHELAARAAQWAQLEQARQRAEDSAARSDTLHAALQRDHIPAEESLLQLAARLDAFHATDEHARELSDSLARAKDDLDAARKRLDAHPFHPLTPQQAAAQPLALPPQPRLPVWLYALVILLGATAAAAFAHFTHAPLLALGVGGIVIGSGIFLAGRSAARRRTVWEEEVAHLRDERERDLAAYSLLYKESESSQAQLDRLHAENDALTATRSANLQTLLRAVSLFAPISDIAGVDRALRGAISRRRIASDAQGLAREEKLRYDVLCENFADLTPSDANLPAPIEDAEELRRELDQLLSDLAACEREHSRLEGERSALPPHAELLEQRESVECRRAQLQQEYHALALAMETLSDANGELQSRFSPALGREAAHIFSALTGGQYDRIYLDRTLQASAAAAGDPTAHSAALLSQGCADQLYLALRLAISRMVLPQDRSIPLILDDALMSFDDARLAHALDFLVQEAKTRQILLFTCQGRERALLCARKDVTFLTL